MEVDELFEGKVWGSGKFLQIIKTQPLPSRFRRVIEKYNAQYLCWTAFKLGEKWMMIIVFYNRDP